jgi:site-specific DNA recombinase
LKGTANRHHVQRGVVTLSCATPREYNGELYEATWEPIVDRDDWQRLRTLLGAPERKVRGFSNGNARKYELSGLVFCADCKRVMVSMSSNRERADGEKIHRLSFTCNELATGGCGSMRIEMHHLERYIEAMLFTRADSPEVRGRRRCQRGGHRRDGESPPQSRLG